MSWTRKPKVLVMSDSSTLHTGFALVARKICTYLYELNQYDLKTIGWFHNNTNGTIIPYEIIPTQRDNHQVAEADKYANLTYPKVIEQYQPDIVIAIGDPWMIEHTALPPEKRNHKLIIYIPIDGMPMMQKWVPVLKNADTVVAYGPFGKAVMHERDKDINIVEINHGVDTELFHPMKEDQYKEIKKGLGGDELFIIGTVCRNQPRKNLPRLIKAGKIFVSKYSVCKQCKELFFDEVDECIFCQGKEFDVGAEKEDVRFYFHMALNDCGWNIAELAGRFGLEKKIAYPQGLQIGSGVEEEVLAKIYNAIDIFTLPTGGEGWGLPIIEAMACGVPVVVPDYSAHVDFCQGAAELIEVSEYMTEPMTNVERAFVDIYDYAMRLDKLYMEDKDAFLAKWGKYLTRMVGEFDKEKLVIGKQARDFLGRAGRDRALHYTWDRINPEWVELINKTLNYNPEDLKDIVEDCDVSVEMV